jgi:2,3-bisphosphoglycerate-independent phosphoglycerate mutase
MSTAIHQAGPVVLVALESPRSELLSTLGQRHAQVRLSVDELDRIEPASLHQHPVARSALRKAKDMGGRLHLLSLLSDGGVESALEHLYAMIALAKDSRVRVVVHAFLDGVDVEPRSAARYLADLERALDAGVGRIGTVSGRLFALDCDERWERVEKVYRAITADGVTRVDSAQAGVKEACLFGALEGSVAPFVVFDYPGVSPVDSALHLDFGARRARELARALASEPFPHFARKGSKAPFAGRFTCMTPYDGALGLPTLFARAPDPSNLALDPLPSSKQALCSEGSAATIANGAARAIRSGELGYVLADFANPDNAALIGSAAACDAAAREVVDAALAVSGAVLLVGGRDATNTVDAVYVCTEDPTARLRPGGFAELAPTILDLLALPPPADLEGASLIVR